MMIRNRLKMASFLGDITGALNSAAGVMSPLGAIAGGVSALGSLFGSSASDDAMDLAKLQHQWDVEENQKNRDFQREEWQRQFNAINAYNDPSAAKSRLTKGGLNASAMLNGSGASIGQSTGSPSAPSGASGLNAMPDVVSQVGFQSQESLFKRLSMLGEISKNAYLLPETKQKLSAEINNILADERFTSIKADSEEFMLSLNRFFEPIMKRAGVEQAFKNLALTDAETRLAIANGDVANEEKQNKAEERLLTIAKRNLSQKEFERLQLEIKWYDAQRQQEIRESRSREVSNYAAANQANATAEQIKFWNDINKRPDVRHELVRAAKEAGKAAINANALSERQIKQLDYMIEQAAFANDMKEFTYWSNQVSSWIESIGSAASQFYGAGALRQLIQLRGNQPSVPLESGRGYRLDENGLLFKRP